MPLKRNIMPTTPRSRSSCWDSSAVLGNLFLEDMRCKQNVPDNVAWTFSFGDGYFLTLCNDCSMCAYRTILIAKYAFSEINTHIRPDVRVHGSLSQNGFTEIVFGFWGRFMVYFLNDLKDAVIYWKWAETITHFYFFLFWLLWWTKVIGILLWNGPLVKCA